MIAFAAKHLYTPLKAVEMPLVLVEDCRVVEVTSRAAKTVPANAHLVDFGDAVIAPGFVDIHIHGAAGHDVMENDPSGLPGLECFIARHGVTGYFPTTVTAPLNQTLAALERLAAAVEHRQSTDDGRRARPLGIHLEGPFISHVKRGVHPLNDLLPPTLETFECLWQAAHGQIKLMTIAPELDGAKAVIAEAAKRGVCVSLGHSNADASTARAAVGAGARHATHAFNAMRALDHRDPGIVGEILSDSRLTADIIADGVHVDPAVVELFLRAKGQEEAVLITDATAATGMPDGRYRLGSLEVEVKKGKCMAAGRLAGSVLTMDCAVRNVMQFANWRLPQALQLATLNPARVTGLTGRGEIKAGCHADMVVLTQSGEVKATIIGGV